MKSQLLRMLESSSGEFISGGAVARDLAVSRNAVWKAAQSLRASGYDVRSDARKGYALMPGGDILSEEGISTYLRGDAAFRVRVMSSAGSTNDVLREMAAKGSPEGHLLAAGRQTAGKGRMGRQFFSPEGSGAYFSLLLRPRCPVSEAVLITSAAAVAAARAIEDIYHVSVGIKWVNDLLVGQKKVCGILTEAALNMEYGLIESAVLGIGVNISAPAGGFPVELHDKATQLLQGNDSRAGERCKLIAATVNNFWDFYRNLAGREFLAEYRSRSVVLGRDVLVLSGDAPRRARALGIDDNCRLIVQYFDGGEAALDSGEISVVPE